jgi:adenosyl cobinamide kinase/adenosyl cobinamide phosphate guanylyltransferase
MCSNQLVQCRCRMRQYESPLNLNAKLSSIMSSDKRVTLTCSTLYINMATWRTATSSQVEAGIAQSVQRLVHGLENRGILLRHPEKAMV